MTHWRSQEQLHRSLSVPLYAESSVFLCIWNTTHQYVKLHRVTSVTRSWHNWGRIVTRLWQDRDTAVTRSWHNWGRIVTQLRQDRDTTEAGSWHVCDKIVTRRNVCNSEMTMSSYSFYFLRRKAKFYIEILKTWSTYRDITMTQPRRHFYDTASERLNLS